MCVTCFHNYISQLLSMTLGLLIRYCFLGDKMAAFFSLPIPLGFSQLFRCIAKKTIPNIYTNANAPNAILKKPMVKG